MRSKYETNVKPNLALIESWARDGICEMEMAKRLDVSEQTFCDYKKKYPELLGVLSKTREIVDNVEMVNAYKRRAEGYNVEETTYVYKYVKKHKTGEMEEVLTRKEIRTKHVPGDPRAMENWLRLRQRDTWADLGRDVAFDTVAVNGVVLLPERRIIEDEENEGNEE